MTIFSEVKTAETATMATRRLKGSRTGSPMRRFFRRLMQQKIAVASSTVLLIILLIAIFADQLMPYDPAAQSLLLRNKPPSGSNLLGTDELGRDLLSRLIAGTRVTLAAPFIAVFVGAVIGVPLGLLAGYFGRWFDWLTSRVADALFAIPGIILAMAVVGVRGPSTINTMTAVGVLFAPRLFRVMRGETMALKSAMFVEAARTTGVAPIRVIRTHIVPNVAGTLIVQCTVLLGFGVLIEAGLSFLGIGVQPPEASWGVLLRSTFANVNVMPYQSLAPGLAITILILAFQFFGDGMRDSLGKEMRDAK